MMRQSGSFGLYEHSRNLNNRCPLDTLSIYHVEFRQLAQVVPGSITANCSQARTIRVLSSTSSNTHNESEPRCWRLGTQANTPKSTHESNCSQCNRYSRTSDIISCRKQTHEGSQKVAGNGNPSYAGRCPL